MPKVLIVDGYIFFFFSNEGDPLEPMHIHVRKGSAEAKIWLEPLVETDRAWGFNSREISEIMKIINDNHDILASAWNVHFNS